MARKLTVNLNGAERYEFVLLDGTQVVIIAGTRSNGSSAEPTRRMRKLPTARTAADKLAADLDEAQIADLFVPSDEAPASGFTVPDGEPPVLGFRLGKK